MMKAIVNLLIVGVCFSWAAAGWAAEPDPDQVFQLGDIVVSAEREPGSNITTISKVTAEEIKASGGSVPYTWALTGGTLPTDLDFLGALNSTAVLNGIPVGNLGDYKFTVSVTDSTGLEVSKDFSFTLTDLSIDTASR